MITLVRPFTSDNYSDLELLLHALHRAGFTARLSDIEWAWQVYSDIMSAGWLCVSSYSEEEQVEILRRRLQPETE